LIKKTNLNSQSNQRQFLYLTTVGWKSGRQHQIEIWFVENEEKYYVISERRKHAHWVQNFIHDSKVSFSVGEKTFNGSARIIDKGNEPKLALEVSKLMAEKYKWSGGLIVELTALN
jgi:deazaflavin-dependent oxidoreductase (nitroreductase family)